MRITIPEMAVYTLAGTGIVTLVKKIGKISSCTVAVDGSLYKKHPKFSQRYV